MRTLGRALVTGLLLASTACASRVPSAVGSFQQGDVTDAIERTRAWADRGDRNEALHLVRMASMQMAAGDLEGADASLVRAVRQMQDFEAHGEFRAQLGVEENKDWLGEPYEKMMAFFYLGVLRLVRGDAGNALAMGKSAVIADAGTEDERYQGDFVPGYVLQALAYRALHEERNAQRLTDRAVDTLFVRTLVDFLAGCLPDGTAGMHGGDAAAAALLAAAPAAAWQAPRDPAAAARFARGRALELLRVSAQVVPRQRVPLLQGLDKAELTAGITALGLVGERFQAAAEAAPPDLFAWAEHTERVLRDVLSPEASLVLVVQDGRGPAKTAVGRYHEYLQIVPGQEPAETPMVTLDGTPIALAYLDSVNHQATTRGGRRVDRFLAGKAVFKDVSTVSGAALLVAADINRREGGSAEASAGLAIAGLAALIAGAATNPAADTRAWELLPGRLWLASADPSPGTHALVVDGTRYDVVVDEGPTQVHLIPFLEPHQPSVLRP